MMQRAFYAMGTVWWIRCDAPALLAQAEALVHDAEARLSRFRPTSALAALNRDGHSVDPLLADVVRAALRFHSLTGGAFDPTLGARLAALGYDRTFTAIRRPPPLPPERGDLRPRVAVDGDRVDLEGPGALDLGGVAKGFTVDRVVAHLLAGGAREVLIDGGGDLRGAGGSWPIGAGDGLVVESGLGAVATSSTRRRRWRDAGGTALHHILDPRTGRPAAAAIDTATVVAPDATTADALATALLVDPDAVMPLLPSLGAHALVSDLHGTWWTTPGAPFHAPARGAGDLDPGPEPARAAWSVPHG